MSHYYKDLPPEQLEDLYNNFLIDSWSHSKVASFARNEKAFEMNYIFGIHSRKSSTTIAGEAYHEAMALYFKGLKESAPVDLVDMEAVAFDYITNVKPNRWKLQKTTPTIEQAQAKATATVTSLLKNFMAEKKLIEDDLESVVEVEVRGSEFITLNGVDIPLPCHFVIDLVIRTKSGKIVVIDHKSKNTFTDEEEVALNIGNQAMIYTLGYEEMSGLHIDEVWFVENKYSSNKDKSPQLIANKVTMDVNTRKLYEAMLYEPVKRLMQATSDPEYLYLINSSDKLVDMAELYDFWARTMICEVEDFNVSDAKKDLVAKRLKKVRDSAAASISPTVIRNFKENAASFIQYDLSTKNMSQSEKIEHVLRSFGIIIKVAHTFEGFSSNTYLLEFSAGTQVSSVYKHRLDLANALDVSNVRIHRDLKVYEGRSYLAMDTSKKREKTLYFSDAVINGRKIPLGVDNFMQTVVWDLDNHSTPHALICGATGSGKSAQIKVILECAKMGLVDRVVIMDPKHEFIHMKGTGFEVYNDIEDIEIQMGNLVADMQVLNKRGDKTRTMVVFDEFADAIANSRKGKELLIHDINPITGRREVVGEHKSLEENLRILLQKGRSIGFRIVAATQRASVKVITGDAKVNFPVQICFRVPKEIDSKVVLDEPGAEGLGGMGDGLIKSPEYNEVVRYQAFYVPDENERKQVRSIPAEIEE